MRDFDKERAKARLRANCTKRVLHFFNFGIFCLSIAYGVLWLMTNIDPVNSGGVDTPMFIIANTFFPTLDLMQKYLAMSVGLFVAFLLQIFPLMMVGKMEEFAIKKIAKDEEKQKEQLEKFEKIKQKVECEKINNYSICFSINFDKEEEIDKKLSDKLTNIFLGQVKFTIEKYIKAVNVSLFDNALIISSKNFEKYDNIYEAFLRILAYKKRKFEKKYEIKIIPSITIDSYMNNENFTDIKNQHLQIKQLRFKNKALSGGTFNKRYLSMEKNKFVSTPIGSYMCGANDEDFDLSIMNKDLNAFLNTM